MALMSAPCARRKSATSPAPYHIELAQAGSKAQIALRAASAEKLGDLDEAEMHCIGHRHAIGIDAIDGGAAVEQGRNRVAQLLALALLDILPSTTRTACFTTEPSVQIPETA